MLQTSFVCYKIDDFVASKVTDSKLMEMGLVYGDILAFRQVFPDSITPSTMNYEERAEELKKQLKRNHTIGNKDAKNRNLKVRETIKVTFALKCYEKKIFVCKRSQSFSEECKRNAAYDDLHNIARLHHKVRLSRKTYLAEFSRKRIKSESFKHIEHYSLLQKDRKKAIQLYLYYPDFYSNLQLLSMIGNVQNDVSEDNNDGEISDVDYDEVISYIYN